MSIRQSRQILIDRQLESNDSIHDPFQRNPIRRSMFLVGSCTAAVGVPWLISDDAGSVAMMTIGWLALTGIVFGIPVFVISLIEELARTIKAHVYPRIDELDLSPRVKHVLIRHGVETISEVESLADAALLSLSNMDERALRELRQSVAVWRYRRWQASGFSARDSAGSSM